MLTTALALFLSAGNPFDAVSYGKGGCGKVEATVQLPCEGSNFEAFTQVACWLGRNYLHPRVTATVLEAYQALSATLPLRRWQYGELGREYGGRLWPHKTHQNGLSADFFVPVMDSEGAPQEVPTSLAKGFGYAVDFDAEGSLGDLRIDWRAIVAHLIALQQAGARHGVTLERIIITPPFQKFLLEQGPSSRALAPLFMKGEAWVRHDEHYHVDFAIPPTQRQPLRCD